VGSIHGPLPPGKSSPPRRVQSERAPPLAALAAFSFFGLPLAATAVLSSGHRRSQLRRFVPVSELSRTINDGTLEIIADTGMTTRGDPTGDSKVGYLPAV